MKKRVAAGIAGALVSGAVACAAAEPPAMPPPAREHEWLMQLVGEWEAQVEMTMDPSQPAMKSQGTETVRPVGGFWTVAKYKGTMMDKPFSGVFTLGYAPEKQKYVGTWIDSMSSRLWSYEGTVDEAGKVLTLSAEGPCPSSPGKLMKFKDTMELVDKDHRVFTSAVQGDDGKWTTGLTIHYVRKS